VLDSFELKDRLLHFDGIGGRDRRLRLVINQLFAAFALARTVHSSGFMTIRPLHDRILAKRVAEKTKTAGGLFIPDTAKEKPLEAIVVAVGSGKILENGQTVPPSVKAGDQVLVGKYTGSEVKLDGEEHIILREEDILAVLEQ